MFDLEALETHEALKSKVLYGLKIKERDFQYNIVLNLIQRSTESSQFYSYFW